ncbi:MAG: LytR C-terminal domain-containing protein [Acidimicrobiales bacterium]
MDRRVDISLWAAIAVIGIATGVLVAGAPELRADESSTLAAGSPPDESDATTTTSTTVTTTTTTTAPTTTTTTEPTTTTTEAPVLRPRETVPVLVANGTPVVGAAGRMSTRLNAEGHPTLTPTTIGSYEVSEVWFVEGYGADAADLARRLEVFPENVMPVPEEPPFAIGDARLVVVMGPDLAE